MNAVEIYRNLIGNKLKPLVVEYKPFSGSYQYYPYRHVFDSSFEVNFTNLLFDSSIFYAFEKDEIEKDYQKHRLDNLRKASRAAYKNRIPKTEKKLDGLMGELTLDCFLKLFFDDIEMLYSRVKYIERIPRRDLNKEVKGKEVKGYDGLVFSVSGNQKYMWVGQVKTGSWDYCLLNIKDDIKKSVMKNYFADSMIIMADIMRAVSYDSTELAKIVDDLNEIQIDYADKEEEMHEQLIKYFKSNNIIIRIPCLIMADESQYCDENELLKIIKNKCSKSFDSYDFENTEELDVEVLFLIFPVRNIDELRNRFLAIRKEAVNE